MAENVEDPSLSGNTGEAETPEALAESAVRALVKLAMMRGTLAAEHAQEVALRAVMALAVPDDPSHAAAVERMRRALVFADKRGDRLVIHDVARAVESAAMLRRHDESAAVRHVGSVLAELAKAHSRAKPPDDRTLGALLGRLAAGDLATSGVVARILLAMGVFGASPLDDVTKRVSQALADRKRRARAVNRRSSPAVG